MTFGTIFFIWLVCSIFFGFLCKKEVLENSRFVFFLNGALNLFAGWIMFDIAHVRMEIIDEYSWDGELCEYELETYWLRYVGLILLIGGIISIVFGIYLKLVEIHEKCGTNPESKPLTGRACPVCNSVQPGNNRFCWSCGSDINEVQKVNQSNQVKKETSVHSWRCPQCGRYITDFPCVFCGHNE